MAEYIQTDAALRKEYDPLHDEEEAAAQPHKQTALIDRDPVERARAEAHRITRTVTAPTLCLVGFVLGGLSVFALCRLSDRATVDSTPTLGVLSDEQSTLLATTQAASVLSDDASSLIASSCEARQVRDVFNSDGADVLRTASLAVDSHFAAAVFNMTTCAPLVLIPERP